MPAYIHRAIVKAYIETAAYQSLPEETIEGILAPWQGEPGQAAFYKQIAQADSKFTDEFQDKFGEVRTPTLILWGEEDTWIPCTQAFELQKKIANAKLVTIEGAGHLVIEEKPQRLVKEIHQFFSS